MSNIEVVRINWTPNCARCHVSLTDPLRPITAVYASKDGRLHCGRCVDGKPAATLDVLVDVYNEYRNEQLPMSHPGEHREDVPNEEIPISEPQADDPAESSLATGQPPAVAVETEEGMDQPKDSAVSTDGQSGEVENIPELVEADTPSDGEGEPAGTDALIQDKAADADEPIDGEAPDNDTGPGENPVDGTEPATPSALEEGVAYGHDPASGILPSYPDEVAETEDEDDQIAQIGEL